MKKIILSIVTILVFALSASAQNSLEQRAINKAEGVARQCLVGNTESNNIEIYSYAVATQICDYANPNPNYFGYTVSVWGYVKCPANIACKVAPFPIATVTVDCGGTVTSVLCGVAEQQ